MGSMNFTKFSLNNSNNNTGSYLWLVENRRDRVRYIYNPACITSHHKEETISSLQYEVLQFLVCEEGGLVGPV